MSQENVEVVRSIFDAMNRRDIGAILSFFAPDALADASDEGTGIFEGADAIGAALREWWGVYAEYRVSADEIVHIDESVVLTVNSQVARLPGSTGEVRMHNAFVWRFEDGMVVRVTMYADPDVAHAAADRLAKERG
jgi:ketosteroid isomerase-like protein